MITREHSAQNRGARMHREVDKIVINSQHKPPNLHTHTAKCAPLNKTEAVINKTQALSRRLKYTRAHTAHAPKHAQKTCNLEWQRCHRWMHAHAVNCANTNKLEKLHSTCAAERNQSNTTFWKTTSWPNNLRNFVDMQMQIKEIIRT